MSGRADDECLFPELRRALRDVAARTQTRPGVVDGLGITVEIGGELVYGGSNRFTQALDDLQYGALDGPCLEAQRTRSLVRSRTIGAGEQRWPAFSGNAAQLDLRSVVSLPLTTSARVAGSLNLYGRAADRFDDLDKGAVTALVEAVQTMVTSPVLLGVARANRLWFDRGVAEQSDITAAAGVLSHRYSLTETEARTLIRQVALEDGLTEHQAARGVLDQEG